MIRSVKWLSGGVALVAVFGLLANAVSAATIIKLSLSSAPADIEFDGTTLSTIDDLDAGNLGEQDTSALFLDFLDSKHADILSPTASFTLDGLTKSGFAALFPAINPVLVIQNFLGGNFKLYDTDGTTLLLAGTLDDSTLTGPIGPPATGALFTTSFGTVTGGTLKPYIDVNTLTLSMSFTQINNGAGFSVAASAPLLNPFKSDAGLNIAADPAVPEPATIWLALAASAIAARSLGGRRR